jgi:phage tail sheath gpL-like
MAAAVNTDLSPGYVLPGVYVQFNFSGASASLGLPQLRALLVGTKLASGIAAQDAPTLCLGQSDANLKGGQGSELARLYAAFNSQIGGGQCDVYVLPVVEPSSGTAATRTLTVSFSTGLAAAAQDSINLWLAGYYVSALVSSGDTATVIAANLAAAINAVKDIPWTAAASTGTVTLTYRHKGVGGEDSPFMGFVPNNAASNVQLSPGTITYSGGPASGAGSATVTIGSTTYSAAVNNADSITVIASNVAAAINATNGPVTASANAGVVTLFFRNDPSGQTRVVQRPSAAMVTTTAVTVTVAAGTLGTGTPTLTNALAVLAAQGQFGYWATSFNDVTSLGAMSAYIEAYANGVYMKDQFLFFGHSGSLTAAGGVPSGTTPALTASGRYHGVWCPDQPTQAFENAARFAAIVATQSNVYPATNYDGFALQSQTSTVPLLLPDRMVRPSVDALNAAITSQNLTPLAVNEATGQLTIVRGRNTLTSSDVKQWDTSFLQCAAFTRYNVRKGLRDRFGTNKSLKSSGAPHTPNTVTTGDIVDAIIEILINLDNADVVDGAQQLKAAVAANVNAVNAGRVDATVPVRYPVNLHQLAPVISQQ